MRAKLLIICLTFFIIVALVNDQKQHASNFILKFNRNTFQSRDTLNLLTENGCQQVNIYQPGYSQNTWLEIKSSSNFFSAKLLRKLKSEHGLQYIEPACQAKLAATPNDIYFKSNRQKYFRRLQIEEAWEKEAGSSRIKVAIIDTGIDTLHPDLEHFFLNKKETPFDAIDNDNNGYVDDLRGWNFVGDNNNVDDDNSHGTHVAGIIGATTNNETGIAGAAGGGFKINSKPRTGVILIPLKTANQNNQHGSNIIIAKAVDLAVNYGAKIINLSLQTTSAPPIEQDPLYQSLSRAAAKGVVLIAASGNTDDSHYANLDNWSQYNLLVNHPDVIAVTATEILTDGRVKVADWSNHDGKKMYACYGSSVEVSAPGKEILSCIPSTFSKRSPYAEFSGTSMAAAVVSGASALILSKNYRLNGQQVLKILQGSATSLFVYGGGGGEINFNKALTLTPDILEPFIDKTTQLLKGFPKAYHNRGKKIITRSSQLTDKLDESNFYDLRIAVLTDFYQLKWSRSKDL